MIIVGHRGARGLETENTLESIKKSLDLGIGVIELDVWTTKDGVPVLSHDSSLARITGKKLQIFDMTIEEIKKIRTHGGYKIPMASEALKLLSKKSVILEIKDYYLSKGFIKLLDDFAANDVAVTSSRHQVLIELNKKRPGIKIFASTAWHPFETLQLIRKHNMHGISLNYHMFSPLIYFYAKRYNIKILLYTINRPIYIKLFKKFRMDVDICSDHPDRLLPLV